MYAPTAARELVISATVPMGDSGTTNKDAWKDIALVACSSEGEQVSLGV